MNEESSGAMLSTMYAAYKFQVHPRPGKNGFLIFRAHPRIFYVVHLGYNVDKSGKTPYQRIYDRRSETALAEFGEKVMYMPPKTERKNMSKI